MAVIMFHWQLLAQHANQQDMKSIQACMQFSDSYFGFLVNQPLRWVIVTGNTKLQGQQMWVATLILSMFTPSQRNSSCSVGATSVELRRAIQRAYKHTVHFS